MVIIGQDKSTLITWKPRQETCPELAEGKKEVKMSQLEYLESLNKINRGNEWFKNNRRVYDFYKQSVAEQEEALKRLKEGLYFTQEDYERHVFSKTLITWMTSRVVDDNPANSPYGWVEKSTVKIYGVKNTIHHIDSDPVICQNQLLKGFVADNSIHGKMYFTNQRWGVKTFVIKSLSDALWYKCPTCREDHPVIRQRRFGAGGMSTYEYVSYFLLCPKSLEKYYICAGDRVLTKEVF